MRGYGYQRLGPKDVDGDPIGGRGLAEFALEARIRLKQFGGNFGVVPFFDGGSLTTEALPDFKDWRFAAGVGVRYYSSFGPIRIDVGVPLNRAEGRRPGRGHRLARPGLLMADARRRYPTGRAAAAPASARIGRGGCSMSCSRCSSRSCSCSPALLVLLDSAPGHRFIVDRIGGFETASGLQHPHRPDRRLDLRQVAAAQRRASPTAAAFS